jgi:hypothetical protein
MINPVLLESIPEMIALIIFMGIFLSPEIISAIKHRNDEEEPFWDDEDTYSW